MYEVLKKMDGWLRNRIRYCIWHDWKKPERKRKNLLRLGVNPNDAYSWSRSRMGGWAILRLSLSNHSTKPNHGHNHNIEPIEKTRLRTLTRLLF